MDHTGVIRTATSIADGRTSDRARVILEVKLESL